jgi:hypothetical protein
VDPYAKIRESDDATFTEPHRKSLGDAIDEWYGTVDATDLSYVGLAALLRELADDYG